MGCCSFEATPATHRGASTTVSPRVDYADVRRACADMELHAILEDSFASQYLLAFAQSELSEEGVCFVLAAHEFKRAVAEFNPVRALELGRKICETHLMPGSDLDINAAVPTQKAATRWLRQYAKDPKASPPVEVIRGAHRIGYRAVAFDVLPRFRQSKFCEELCALHLTPAEQRRAARAARPAPRRARPVARPLLGRVEGLRDGVHHARLWLARRRHRAGAHPPPVPPTSPPSSRPPAS